LFAYHARRAWVAAGQDGWIDYNDAGLLCTSHLGLGGHVKTSNLGIIEMNPEVAQQMRNKTVRGLAKGYTVHEMTNRQFVEQCAPNTVVAHWFDYFGTWNGNRDLDIHPCAELDIFLRRRCLKCEPFAILAVTVCLRTRMGTVDIQDMLVLMCGLYGYRATILADIQYGSSPTMRFVLMQVRHARNHFLKMKHFEHPNMPTSVGPRPAVSSASAQTQPTMQQGVPANTYHCGFVDPTIGCQRKDGQPCDYCSVMKKYPNKHNCKLATKPYRCNSPNKTCELCDFVIHRIEYVVSDDIEMKDEDEDEDKDEKLPGRLSSEQKKQNPHWQAQLARRKHLLAWFSKTVAPQRLAVERQAELVPSIHPTAFRRWLIDPEGRRGLGLPAFKKANDAVQAFRDKETKRLPAKSAAPAAQRPLLAKKGALKAPPPDSSAASREENEQTVSLELKKREAILKEATSKKRKALDEATSIVEQIERENAEVDERIKRVKQEHNSFLQQARAEDQMVQRMAVAKAKAINQQQLLDAELEKRRAAEEESKKAAAKRAQMQEELRQMAERQKADAEAANDVARKLAQAREAQQKKSAEAVAVLSSTLPSSPPRRGIVSP